MPRLSVLWRASGGRARGFYHPDEERLVVCLHEAGTFSSFIDGPGVQVDLDAEGHFIGLTVDLAREAWPVAADLWAPKIGIPATVRFRDFPTTLAGVRMATDPDRQWLRIKLADGACEHTVEPCEGVLFEVSTESELLSMWVLSIQEDYGSRHMRAWRARAN